MAQTYSQRVLDLVKAKHSHEKEFIQAVQEVLSTIEPVLAANSKYEDHAILERIVEPERTILFRVPWIDDQGLLPCPMKRRKAAASWCWLKNSLESGAAIWTRTILFLSRFPLPPA